MPLLSWLTDAPRDAKRALLAASLGWMLDAFDVMLYALVLASLMGDFGLSKATAGLLGSLTLVASAAGGVVFGVVAVRYGRTRALMASILVYSVFTAACGLAQALTQLAVFRFLLGLGMGGEWASGAALVSETWPHRDRGKAMGVMQSSWAVGYAAAALVTGLVLPRFGWRAGQGPSGMGLGEVPVHEAAFLDGSNNLRSHKKGRYSGDAAVFGNLDARLRLFTLPFVLRWDAGVYGLGDLGRVYLKDETSSTWHYSAGGGFWVAASDRSVVGRMELATGDDGIGFRFGTNFKF